MKRRDFLTTSSIIGVAAATSDASALAVGSDSVYGSCGARSEQKALAALQQDKIRLALSRVNFPVGFWDDLTKLATGYIKIASSDEARMQFRKDPAKFLLETGVDLKGISNPTDEIHALKQLADEEILSAARTGDIELLLSAIRRKGRTVPVASLGNQTQKAKMLADILSQDAEHLKRVFAQVRDKIERGETPDFAGKEISFILDTLSSSESSIQPMISVAAAVSLVWIAVAVHEYVLASVAVVAALALVVWVSVSCEVAVNCDGEEQESLKRQNGALLTALAPDEARNYTIAAHALAMQGNKAALKELSELIAGKELEMILDAFSELGVLNLTPEMKLQVLTASKSLAMRASTGVSL